jgi:hypothetical protein
MGGSRVRIEDSGGGIGLPNEAMRKRKADGGARGWVCLSMGVLLLQSRLAETMTLHVVTLLR